MCLRERERESERIRKRKRQRRHTEGQPAYSNDGEEEREAKRACERQMNKRYQIE